MASGSAGADADPRVRDRFTVTSAGNLAGALRNLALAALPAELAGRIRLPVQPGFETIGAYGGGLTTFVVLAVRGSAGRNLVPDVVSAGGTPLDIAGRDKPPPAAAQAAPPGNWTHSPMVRRARRRVQTGGAT